ncbi:MULTISPECIES: Lsr2 family protein [unclassified Streptomyces]|uniref:histone-like nucleoid-structuring protein Lsr2 n=1 Tax=unclassified Streptomyces TaxID=2593676 RepID=UPI00380F2F56
MAQKIVTIYTDDLTGEESTEAATHTLALDGVTYEFDLSPDSYDQLLEAVAPFTRVGRRTGKGKKAARKGASSGENTAEIRAWAKANGFDVNDRGRVPAEIREAYTKAGN